MISLILALQMHVPTIQLYGNSVQALIAQEAQNQGLEPQIALAVAKIESGFNALATGSKGEMGLFQLRPEYIPIPKTLLYNPKVNARWGVKRLLYYRDHCPHTKDLTWITCFNSGEYRHPRYPKLLPYYKRFLEAYLGN